MGLLFVFIAQVAGILISAGHPVIPGSAYICMAASVCCALLWVQHRIVWIFVLSGVTLLVSAGLCSTPSVQCADELLSVAGHGKVGAAGWIKEYVQEYPDRQKFIVQIDDIGGMRGEKMQAGRGCLVQIFVFDKGVGRGHLLRGDYVRAAVRLKKPKNLNNPGSFDYRSSLARKGVGLIAYVGSRDDIIVDPARTRTGIRRWIDSARLRIKDVILSSTGGQTVAGIVTALVIGDQGFISRDIRRMFASTGVIHILVVAGLHLAIITHLFYLLMKFALSRSAYVCLHANIPKLSLSLSLVPMLAYIFISGANAPVVRSGTMIAVYCALFLLNKTKARWTGILVAGILILALDPMAVYSISFQLSFTAVASIIAFMPVISRITSAGTRKIESRWQQTAVQWLLGMFLVSLFVTLGLSGVLAYYFNTIPLFGILLNLIVIPFFCYVVLPLSLIASAAGLVLPWLGHALFLIIAVLLHGIVGIVWQGATASLASLRVPTPTVFELFLYYACLIAALNTRHSTLNKTLPLLGVLCLLGAADAGYYVYETRFVKTLRITFIDVGQGDSAVIEFPYGTTMLIDAGGGAYRRYDTGEAIVARYLWSYKRSSIDYVVSSHPQDDHVAGLGFIIANMGVKRVYKSDCAPDTAVYRAFTDAVSGSGAQLSTITNTVQTFAVNGVNVRLFSMPHEACDAGIRKDINNDAVLVKLTYKKVSILFTGDIEKDAEGALVAAYGDALRSTIMKAAHHGSATSSTGHFLDAVGPRVVIIPVGKDNPFRMPAKSVLRRLLSRGIRVVRTDRSGAITIITDGEHIEIKTYLDNETA